MAEVKMQTYRSWTFEVLRAPDDNWPDERPHPWSTVGRTYRPGRVQLVFVRRDGGPVKLDGSTIYGPRIVKAGPVGAVVDERLYGQALDEPWFMDIATTCMGMIIADLKGADRG